MRELDTQQSGITETCHAKTMQVIMSNSIKATVYVTWDETGEYSAHVEAEEAADDLEGKSDGKFRRVLELRLTLPSAGPQTMNLAVEEQSAPPSLRK